MEPSISIKQYENLPLDEDVSSNKSHNSALQISNFTKQIIEDNGLQRDFVRMIISVTESDESFDVLFDQILSKLNNSIKNEDDTNLHHYFCLIHLSDWFLTKRGDQNGWQYSETNELKKVLKELLIAKLKNK